MVNWDKRVESYDDLNWVNEKKLLDKLRKTCKLSMDSVVLDLGTGTGVVAKYFSPFCGKVYGLDNSDDMLVKALDSPEYGDNVFFHLGDAEDPPFGNNVFDCIVARMSLHHIEDPMKVILKCYDLLKKNGSFVICEAIPPEGCFEFYKKFFRIKEKRHVFSRGVLELMLEQSGFLDIEHDVYQMKEVSIKNWLVNSGLSEGKQRIIYNQWYTSPSIVKEKHNIQFTKDDIIVDWYFLIIQGIK